jgi:hypothetical protein
MKSIGDIFAKAANYAFGTGQIGGVFPVLEPKPVTLERAVEIFDTLAAMKDIAFNYPEEGCFARAHLMLRRMFDMGETPKKAWAFEKQGGDLLVKLPDGHEIIWWAHVAAALPVIMPDGTVQDLVIDPSLFKGPVTLKNWGAVMGVPDYNLMFADAGKAPHGHHGDYNAWMRTTPKTDALAEKDMREYLPMQHEKRLPLFDSPLRDYVEKLHTDDYSRGAIPPPPADDTPARKLDMTSGLAVKKELG